LAVPTKVFKECSNVALWSLIDSGEFKIIHSHSLV